MKEEEKYPVSQYTFDRLPDDVKRYLRVVDYPERDAPQSNSRPSNVRQGSKPLPKAKQGLGLPQMTEQELQDSIIELAYTFGWLVAHFRPAMTSRTYTDKKGKTKNIWVTAVSADGEGFPDLVLAKPGHLIFSELKSDKGRLSPEQIKWGQALAGSVQWDYCIWRPADWMNGTIERILGVV